MTKPELGDWLKNFDDAARRERVWQLGLLTGLRGENGNAAPRPNRITRSGLRPGIPIRAARSGRIRSTSSG